MTDAYVGICGQEGKTVMKLRDYYENINSTSNILTT